MGQAEGDKKEERINVDGLSQILHDYSSSDITVFL
jgi:hypothetical protein|tara:strand:- start:480 stop:584 length:105 start_codon:yes stop_codon:yes gene_type:complete